MSSKNWQDDKHTKKEQEIVVARRISDKCSKNGYLQSCQKDTINACNLFDLQSIEKLITTSPTQQHHSRRSEETGAVPTASR
eukprot:m.170852 g.170852  ORF g.170852 m.170852 type:complete len:82 (-) comp18271_c0_seq5:111-356(-)